MTTPAPQPYSEFCPRCDRQFTGSVNNKKLVRQTLSAHIRRAHPDYLHLWED
jgi:hypothetical protein